VREPSLPPAPTANGRLLAALHQSGSASRAKLTSAAGLARSAAGSAVQELQDLGVLVVRPPAASGETRGRPSPVLELLDDGPWVATCELRPDALRIGAAHLGRTLSATRTLPCDATTESPADVLARVGRHLSRFIRKTPGPCVGVGLSLPGMVDTEAGVAKSILSMSWHGVPVRSLLARHLPKGLWLTIGRDAEFAALGEHRVGAGRGASRLLYLLGEAVGLGGMVIDSRIEWSRHQHALQAGHMVVDPQGPRCLCGSRGCLEVFTDGRAIARAVGAKGPFTPEGFQRAVVLGLTSRQVDRIRAQVLPRLRQGLVSLVNVLGPDMVVLGGVLAPLRDLAEEELRSGLRQSVVADVEHVTLVRSELDDAVLFGAAEAAFEPLLHDPKAVLRVAARA